MECSPSRRPPCPQRPPYTISIALLFKLLLNTGVLKEAQTSLELMILPPSPSECWDYWCVPCLTLIFSLDGYLIYQFFFLTKIVVEGIIASSLCSTCSLSLSFQIIFQDQMEFILYQM